MICCLCYHEAQETDAKLAEEEFYMQTLSGRRSNGLSPQSRRIAVVAIVLFALSGLISGFAVGAFVRPKIGGTGNNGGNSLTPIVEQTKTTTPVATPRPVRITIHNRPSVSFVELENGSTYTVTAHLDNVIDKNGQPVHADNLTCKLWLISRVPDDQGVSISSDIASNLAAINGPITLQGASLNNLQDLLPGITYPEITQGLTFDDATPQTHDCSTYKDVTWRYQVSTSVNPGKYTLVVLYDWSGKHWDWFWVDITIKQANSN
jgi:hypothetical protein